MAPTTRSSKPKKSPGSNKKKKRTPKKSESVQEAIDYPDDKSDIVSDDSLYDDLELEELAQQAAELMAGHVHAAEDELSTGSTPGSSGTDPEAENDLEAVLPFVVDVDSNVNSKIKISTNHDMEKISRNFNKITEDENVEEDNDDFMSLTVSMKQTTPQQQKEEKEEGEVFISLESGQDEDKNMQKSQTTKSKRSVKKDRNTKEIELPTELDPGIDVGETYFDFIGQSGIDKNNKAAKEVLTASSRDKLLKNSILSPDFEKHHSVPSHKESIRQMQRRKKKERESKTGDGWYNMAAAEMTDKLRNDIRAIRMRSSLDPKRFYKHNDMKALPKFVQVGTVVESAADFYHSRVPKKQRKQTIVDELLADAETRRYNKRKYMELQEKRSRWHKGKKGTGKKRKKTKK
ncbi:deoxynucleotidyltransferase terminal-interacting protein 2-like [Asterias rubens]|uniref:deoxynucleotidyltransferase terminal-interacting protein 2-like n=1 Tax=Asterias rubens TaxID=7604 RepID=UPI0014559EE7|nr:deoxynucleotidyltransferase terminal-interacting protein 2-like [Asterias rubens]